jgi:hypothetical protein
MRDDVERVARAIAKACGLDPDGASPKAAKAGHSIPEWMFFTPAARAAMAATLELTAEAMRAAYAPGMRIRPADAADWLQQRAKELGNGCS